ncbi:hypothetical protein HN832_03265 [archaeon]|jgi:hypothetical protein|nr:hypothetical protein [archaeon]MBT4373584.1 hypothetical protein [archaeon]MBT4532032.1 hypothetical protein [archaeon]MBT7001699.1 hypothetical protein [archaeon]MBT7282409.1 hypothetical protein [archaeon]
MRSEWLDAYFEQRSDGMYILTQNKTKAEKLEDYLGESKIPGISLDSWLNNPTKQGLPRADVPEGDLYFWAPEDGRVAGFDVFQNYPNFLCNGNPDFQDPHLGVRAVKGVAAS